MWVMRYPNNIFFMNLKGKCIWINNNTYKSIYIKILTLRVLSNLPENVEKQYKTMSSPTQYIQSPLGDTVEQTKSPPSLLPLAKDLTIWNKIYMKLKSIDRFYIKTFSKIIYNRTVFSSYFGIAIQFLLNCYKKTIENFKNHTTKRKSKRRNHKSIKLCDRTFPQNALLIFIKWVNGSKK